MQNTLIKSSQDNNLSYKPKQDGDRTQAFLTLSILTPQTTDNIPIQTLPFNPIHAQVTETLLSIQCLGQKRDDFIHVSDNPIVSGSEDGGFFIVVDGDDDFGIAYAKDVLHLSGYAHG